jgi:hypothetical protein
MTALNPMTAAVSWTDSNQQYLAESLAALREFLDGKSTSVEEIPWSLTRPAAIEALCSAFGLSSFERKVLLLCAGAEMDSGFASLFNAGRGLPTFEMALAAFSDAHWSALTPSAPLRRWRLIELTPDAGTLVNTPLRIQERVLHYLAGVDCLDERLLVLVKRVPAPAQIADSQREIAEQICSLWARSDRASGWPVVVLAGAASENHRAIAGSACDAIGLTLHSLDAADLPQNAQDLDTLIRLWERESILGATALLVECSDQPPAAFVEHLRTPLFVSARSAVHCSRRSTALFDVGPLGEREQGELWQTALVPRFPNLNGAVESLVSQFNLSATAITAAWEQALSMAQSDESLKTYLWDACRMQARPRLEGLAQRMESTTQGDDLVLRNGQKQTLRHIAIHVRHRSLVYNTWGFGNKGGRGLGITALFAGPSGTGKTMAAEVLANELRLDLYRIDLSQVVSKYIGETEKNLSRVFDGAEEGAAVLLFDEADALFGKRSDVKDSHDRYANIEVSYLLQRMEAYRGLAILTTNRKSALDQAFLRRIRFVVDFPFPEAAERKEIWRRVLPSATPVADLRMDRLCSLNAAGGNIRNIALNAAFLAADAGEPVRMTHILTATRGEFAKLERPLSDVEIAGWV